MRLVDFADRRIMQLRCFYAHAGNRYKDVNAEPITNDNKHLLQCKADGSPQGQERFLILCSPQSYEKHLKGVLKADGGWEHNFVPAAIYVDEYHETKSDDAPTPKAVLAIKEQREQRVFETLDLKDGEKEDYWFQRAKPAFLRRSPFVCGFSATPWMKSFRDLAAMTKMIEQPWWASDAHMRHMTGDVCREIGKDTENMEARSTEPSADEREITIARMKKVLTKVMIKRTAKSIYINNNRVLVVLPPHETRRVKCPLSDKQRSIIADADSLLMSQAKAEHELRCKEAKRLNKPMPAPNVMSFFAKAHKLRAVTVISNILAFAHKYGLKLTDDEARNGKDCHGPGQRRPEWVELEGKKQNWLKYPEESLYAMHLKELTDDFL